MSHQLYTQDPTRLVYRPSTGLHSYDDALFLGGMPAVSNVHVGGPMSSLWQRKAPDASQGIEIEVPASDSLVILSRTGQSYAQFCRFAGTAVDLRVGPDFVFIIPAGLDSFWGGEMKMTEGWFHLHIDRATVSQAALEFRFEYQALAYQDIPRLKSLVDVAISATSDSAPSDLLWEGLSWTILFEIANTFRRKGIGSGARGHRLAPWQIRRAIEFMRANLDTPIRLAEMAEICQVSPFHFARGFRNAMNVPPHRYLVLLRIDHAKDLLKGSPLSITEIAMAAGYETPQAFARAFRQTTGYAPSRYREMLRP
jgi:AraC family transcriptional regulator